MGCCNWKQEEAEVNLPERYSDLPKVDSFFDIILHSNSFVDNERKSSHGKLIRSEDSLMPKNLEKAFLTSTPISDRSLKLFMGSVNQETQDSSQVTI